MTTPCTPCIKANPIPSCAEVWQVAQVPGKYDDMELYYVITNVATGYIWTGNTDTIAPHGHGHGQSHEVVITLPDDLTELDGHYYKIELFEETEDEGLLPVTMHIDGTEACCIEFTTFNAVASTVHFTDASCDA
jgi:hypothetical protein